MNKLTFDITLDLDTAPSWSKRYIKTLAVTVGANFYDAYNHAEIFRGSLLTSREQINLSSFIDTVKLGQDSKIFAHEDNWPSYNGASLRNKLKLTFRIKTFENKNDLLTCLLPLSEVIGDADYLTIERTE